MNELQPIIKRLNQIRDVEISVFSTVHQQIKKRIFDEGKDSSGSEIGTYSLPYLKKRQKKGLGGNRKVILQFTGQMINDFVLIEGDTIGSGFLNKSNYEKSLWVEDTYDVEIFEATKEETDLAVKLLDQELNKLFNGV